MAPPSFISMSLGLLTTCLEHTVTPYMGSVVMVSMIGVAKGRTNVIGALLGGVLLTVSMFESTINTDVYTAWVKQDLIPKLPPQSIIVMDNATFHKGNEMKIVIEEAGHTLLYLPPYSPDLNPIEKKWAQAKALRRRIGGSIHSLFKHSNL